MSLKDSSSTAGRLDNPRKRRGSCRNEMKLVAVLRRNLLNRECCQQKFAEVQSCHQGKPLHGLQFADVICCCDRFVARIANAQAAAHACTHGLDGDPPYVFCHDPDPVTKATNIQEEREGNLHCMRLVDGGDGCVGDILDEIPAEGNSDGDEACIQMTMLVRDKFEGNGNAYIGIMGTCTQKALLSCAPEPILGPWSLQNYLQQSHVKHFKPFSNCYDDTDRSCVPHDLLLDILLRRLPLMQIISARVVCRAWHEVLTSPTCFHLLAHNRDAAQQYLMVQISSPSKRSCLTFFDRKRKCWLCTPIDLPCLPLVAAAGGLFCFGNNVSSPSWSGVLMVGNPLTQQWKELPPVPMHVEEKECSPWCAMSADSQEASYKVFVVYSYTGTMCIYTYDSTIGQWRRFKQKHGKLAQVADDAINISLLRRTFTLSPQGCLLQVSFEEGCILSYNTRDGCFRVIELLDYPDSMDEFDLNVKCAPYSRLPALVPCGERFYLVGRTMWNSFVGGGRLPFTLHGRLGIWELKVHFTGTYGKWSWCTSHMQDLANAIIGSDGTDFYVTTDAESKIFLFLTGGTTMLAYDISSKEWSHLPGCPAAHLLNLQGEAYYQPLLWPFAL